ncbi:MAG: hypothetical protein ACTSWQ_10675 [Candidatus Thorarchaeota archaeon]
MNGLIGHAALLGRCWKHNIITHTKIPIPNMVVVNDPPGIESTNAGVLMNPAKRKNAIDMAQNAP